MDDKYFMLEMVVEEDIRGLINLVSGKEKDAFKFATGSAAHLASIAKLLFKSVKTFSLSKEVPELTKKLRDELRGRIPFVVKVFNDKSPTTFLTLPSHVIFVSNTLLDLLDDDEVMAMLLREVGAAKQMHVPLKLATGEVLDTILNVARDKVFEMLKRNPKNTTLIVLAAALTILLQNIMQLYVDRWIDRRLEYSKDNYAVKKGYGPQLLSAIKKIKASSSKRDIIDTKTQKTIKWLDDQFDKDPSSADRIKNIMKDEKALQQLAG